MIASFLHALTGLGDSIITLPIAAFVLIWLSIWGDRRVALSWLAALIACGAVTAALKIYFKACPLPGLELDSPSGHTSMSMFVYGGVALITAAQYRRWPRPVILALGGLLIFSIAVSRAWLQYHSKTEVVIGVVIGIAALTAFWLLYRFHRPARMPAWPIWLAALIPIIVLSGHSISAEGLLRRIADYIHAIVGFCV